MINAVIIEDEPLARSKLKRLLNQLDASIRVVRELESVAQVRQWLTEQASHDKVQVIFSDIQLNDGNVFEVYQQQPQPCPIIFITAYDDFLLQAFESQGIAYLLKPYNSQKLEQAWAKFCALSVPKPTAVNAAADSSYKQHRLAIKHHQQEYFLDIGEITHVQADGGLVMAFDREAKRHFLSFSSLQAAEQALADYPFFRINRSELVQREHVQSLQRYCKNTLTITLTCGAQLKTSQSRTAAFKEWLR